jgi:hypothetical protein
MATCTAHHIILDLIAQLMFVTIRKYVQALRSIPQFPVTSFYAQPAGNSEKWNCS